MFHYVSSGFQQQCTDETSMIVYLHRLKSVHEYRNEPHPKTQIWRHTVIMRHCVNMVQSEATGPNC